MLSRRYNELSLPITIIAGEGDKIAHPGKHADRLSAELPHARLMKVPAQGHLFHYAVPDLVSSAIDQMASDAVV